MSRLQDLVAERAEVITAGSELIESFGDKELAPEERAQLREHQEKLETLNAAVKEAEEDESNMAAIRAAKEADDQNKKDNRIDLYGSGGRSSNDVELAKYRSPGDAFIHSEGYKEWMQMFPDGMPSAGSFQGKPVQVPNLRGAMGLPKPAGTSLGDGEKLSEDKFRALVTSADASAGYWVDPLRRGLLETGLQRPLTVRNLITVIPVTTDTIEYVKEASRVEAAAPVAEATALTGTSGTKPEGGLTFTSVTDTVRTIAEWVPATRRILQDAPGLRAYIDQYLTEDLAEELEDQIIAGSGSGENFTGILNTVNVDTVATGGSNNLDRIRRALRLIRVEARTQPTAILVNPEDMESIDVMKSGGSQDYFGLGPYGGGTGVASIWGVRTVESESVPQGTALVGDFRRAVLFDRENTTIQVGTVNDDFIRNIVRILAELRAGFAVLRPKAFKKVTFA